MLIDDAFGLFVVSRQARGCTERTIHNYRWRVGLWRRDMAAAGVEDLDGLTPELCDQWLASVNATDAAAKSRRELINAAAVFLRFCHRRGYVERDAAAWLTLPYIDYLTTTRRRRMARDDFRRMRAVLEKQAARGRWRDLALFVFVADTGCRRGEAAALRWEDVDFEQKRAMVAGKMRRHGHRPVLFTSRCAEILRHWRAEWEALELDHDSVFVSVRRGDGFGFPMTPDAISQVFKRTARKAGVTRNYGPQNLRHAVGHEFTMGANLEVARQKLGHTRVTTTLMFYAGVEPEDVAKATEALSWLR